MKPCIIGIILATGLYMVLHNIFEDAAARYPNAASVILTALLSMIYFGSRKIRKNGISPISLICISALAGILAYGNSSYLS